MMKRNYVLLMSGAVLIGLAGCKTTDGPTKTRPLKWEQQQAYFKTVRDPRIFGMNLYQTPSGVEVRGGGRLHGWQTEVLDMKLQEPMRPVVDMVIGFGTACPILIDLTTPQNWMEYSTAQKLKAHAIAERDPIVLRSPGDEVPGCLSTMSAVKLGQFHVEHPLVYVRMATGSLGPLGRDIFDPEPRGVLGWIALRNMERIQFIYSSGKVLISALEEPYEAHPERLAATLPIEKTVDVCAVHGKVNGKDTLIAIDPAGDFEVATPRGEQIASLELGTVARSFPTVAISPGGYRVGARFLENYLVTICPQDGVVYLEVIPLPDDGGNDK